MSYNMEQEISTTVEISCDSCGYEILADTVYEEIFEAHIYEEFSHQLDHHQALRDIEISGEYYDVICESCSYEIEHECVWCSAYDPHWCDDSYHCEGGFPGENHKECFNEYHLEQYELNPDSFTHYADTDTIGCNYCETEYDFPATGRLLTASAVKALVDKSANRPPLVKIGA